MSAGIGDDPAAATRAAAAKPGAVDRPYRPGAFSGLRRGETIAGYLFLLPNLLGFLAFNLVPIAFAFALTTTDWNLVDAPRFAGLGNYDQLLRDALFWKTAGNSLYYTLGAVPIGVFLAFWLALLLNRQMKGVVFLRTVFFLPHVTLTVAIAVVWAWIYHPDLGLINYLLGLVGIDGPRWLQSTTWAMPAIILMSNWKGIGYAMLIFLAGLQGIPEEYYEAATIDGAGWLKQLRHITVPLLSPTTFFILVTSFIGAMQGFDQFYVMTQGGPAFATTTVVMYVYDNGFQFFKMGYAATVAAMLFLAIFLITLLQWWVAKTWVYGFDADEPATGASR
ncbi:MAG TPA: sugar ABC transporter permease [Chloroflexota bacterium]|nr:sugar ABC transporter permease [Chloroflexota bacterium]